MNPHKWKQRERRGRKRYALIILTGVFFFLMVLFVLLCIFMDESKGSGEKVADKTEAQTEEATPADADGTKDVTEAVLLNEATYLLVIEDILTDADMENLPITADGISMYENSCFEESAVTDIAPIDDMCSFSDGTAVFSVTTGDETAIYGVSFTVYENEINYIEVYVVPDGGDELEE